MEKNDPLIETSVNILNSLRIYRENTRKLDEKIMQEEEDKAQLENCLSMMKVEAEKVKNDIEELTAKQQKMVEFRN